MNTEEDQKTPFLRLPYWIRCVLILWFLLGVVPLFIEEFGFRYLPSPDWADQVRIPAAASGIVMAVLLFWSLVNGAKMTGRFKEKFEYIMVLLFAPFFGFIIGSTAVTVGGPMLGAVIYRTETEMLYTVTMIRGSGNRRCRRPITLGGLPLMFDELCGYPEEFGRSLDIGGQVLVTGHGSRNGIFVQSVRRID